MLYLTYKQFMFMAEIPELVFQAFEGHDAGAGPLPLHPFNEQQPGLEPMEASSEVVEDRDDGKFQHLILHTTLLTRLRRLPECCNSFKMLHSQSFGTLLCS